MLLNSPLKKFLLGFYIDSSSQETASAVEPGVVDI